MVKKLLVQKGKHPDPIRVRMVRMKRNKQQMSMSTPIKGLN